MPALMGYLRKNLQYPQEACEVKKERRVIVQFIVEKDGSIHDAKVLRSVDPLLYAEALRVVNGMHKWYPVKQNGQTVRTSLLVPVQFELDN